MTEPEPIRDYVKRRLNDVRGEWRKIESITGVAYGTIANIAQGKSSNPTIGNLQPLVDYFREFDAMIERLRHGGAKADA